MNAATRSEKTENFGRPNQKTLDFTPREGFFERYYKKERFSINIF
jgi:hypothetical protein